jgi:hypothetical protein
MTVSGLVGHSLWSFGFQISAEGTSMKTISLCLVTILVVNAYALAYSEEPQPDALSAVESNAQQIEKVKMAIQQRGTGEKSRVKIRMRDKTELKGYISQIDSTSFQLTDNKTGAATTISYDSVDKVGGPGMAKSTKLVLYIGVAVAAAAIILGVLAAKLNHS